MSDQNPNCQVLDQRHLYRMKLTQALFALEFAEGKYQALSEEDGKLVKKDAEMIYAARQVLDDKIGQYATERPLAQINKIDLAILRIVVFESENKIPASSFELATTLVIVLLFESENI